MLQILSSRYEGKAALKLQGELTIYAVAEAHRELQAQEAKHPDLILDLSAVTEMDSAGFQLLLWLKRRVALRGRSLALVHHSSAVVEVLDLLAVAGEFGDPILLSPSEA